MDGQFLYLALVIGGFGCFMAGLLVVSIWTGLPDRTRRPRP